MLGWLLAGNSALNMSNLDDADLVARMLDSFAGPLRHGRGLLLEGQVHRWVGMVNGLPGGYALMEPEVRHLPEPSEHPGLFVVGDYLFDSTVNGVLLDSADLVADLIAERIVRSHQAGSNGNGALHPTVGDPSPHLIPDAPAFSAQSPAAPDWQAKA